MVQEWHVPLRALSSLLLTYYRQWYKDKVDRESGCRHKFEVVDYPSGLQGK
jgi:hypothetical protein